MRIKEMIKRIKGRLNDLNRIVKIQQEKYKESMTEGQVQQRIDLEYFLGILREETNK